jgi:hypothetical protein
MRFSNRYNLQKHGEYSCWIRSGALLLAHETCEFDLTDATFLRHLSLGRQEHWVCQQVAAYIDLSLLTEDSHVTDAASHGTD